MGCYGVSRGCLRASGLLGTQPGQGSGPWLLAGHEKAHPSVGGGASRVALGAVQQLLDVKAGVQDGLLHLLLLQGHAGELPLAHHVGGQLQRHSGHQVAARLQQGGQVA